MYLPVLKNSRRGCSKMTRVILSGCNGRMGRVITACIAERCNCRIVAGFDINTESHAGFPVYANPANCSIEADVLIDFSHPSALAGVLAYALEANLPAVIATTGLVPEQVESLKKASNKIPVFFSANMSLGINLLLELCKKAASVLGNDFDVEILEKHHNQKIDSPSGTALMLANAVSSGLDYTPAYIYDRHELHKKRDKAEIGFSSIRGGTIVGDHDVIFAGHDEVITISHSATSKEVFATGSINAALFLKNQSAGFYSMSDMISVMISAI